MNNNSDNKSDTPGASSTPGSQTGDRSSEESLRDTIENRNVIRNTNTTSAAFTNKTRNNNSADESGASLTEFNEQDNTNSEQSNETFDIRGIIYKPNTEFERQELNMKSAMPKIRHSTARPLLPGEQFSRYDIHHSRRFNNETPPKEVALPTRHSPPPQQIAATTQQEGYSAVDSYEEPSTRNPSRECVPARAVDSNHMRDDQDDTGSPASFYTSRTTDSPASGGHRIVRSSTCTGNGGFEGSGNDNEGGMVCIN